MKTFGLTGGIGTGKSTVGRLLRDDHGIPVLDADRAAREVVAPGSDGLAEIARQFGDDVLTDDGALDRAAMRRLVMADADARRRLEGITHPRIFEALAGGLRALAEAGEAVAGVEAALMVETGSYALYDALVVVACSEAHQIARVVARDGGTEDDARRVLAAQKPVSEKVALADHVVWNDGTLEELRSSVAVLAERLRALAEDA